MRVTASPLARGEKEKKQFNHATQCMRVALYIYELTLFWELEVFTQDATVNIIVRASVVCEPGGLPLCRWNNNIDNNHK